MPKYATRNGISFVQEGERYVSVGLKFFSYSVQREEHGFGWECLVSFELFGKECAACIGKYDNEQEAILGEENEVFNLDMVMDQYKQLMSREAAKNAKVKRNEHNNGRFKRIVDEDSHDQ